MANVRVPILGPNDVIPERFVPAVPPTDAGVAGRVTEDGATRAALDARYPAATVVSGTGIDRSGVADSTAAVQARFNTAGASAFGPGRVHFPTGRYVIDSVSITKDVTVTCEPGVTFRRKAAADAASGSYWDAGAAMFSVDAPGLTVTFANGFIYDGNSSGQTATEPTGAFLRTMPTATVTTAPTTVKIRDALFTNGTSGYLLLRGDDNRRRYQTLVTLDGCTFTDTVYGKGAGDPATPTALGYHPTYVHVYDYVTLTTYDFRATFDKPVGSGNYAPCAINLTYFGSNFATSGEASALMHGTTYLRGMGRSHRVYNNAAAWTNNGIGAIDAYGNAEEVYVEHVYAKNCDNIPVRAKASLKRFTVKSATLDNCHRGVSVQVSSTGPDETVVSIGDVVAYGGTIPVVEVVGSSATSRVQEASVGKVHAIGPITNPEGLTTEGALYFRNLGNLTCEALTVEGAPSRGVTVVDVDHAVVKGLRIDGAGTLGLFATYAATGGTLDLSGFDIRNTGAEGVSVAGTPTKVVIRDGRTSGTVNYGVFSNNTCPDVTITAVTVDTVTGSSRGFYAGAGTTTLIGNRVGAGVTTPLLAHASATRREDHNSWSPTITGASDAVVAGFINTDGSASEAAVRDVVGPVVPKVGTAAIRWHPASTTFPADNVSVDGDHFVKLP